jgi:two-component system, NtrC family, response regulator HydG
MLQVGSLPESILNATGTELSAAHLKSREEGMALGPADDAFAETAESDEDDGLAGEEMVRITGDALDFNKHKEAFEREFIVKALKQFKGRINQTALHANIPKKTLLRKIEKYGLNARDYAE